MKAFAIWNARHRFMLIWILVIVVLVIWACWYGSAPLTRSSSQGINVLEQVELGGLKQWISIRGTDVNNPVLLFLHGGPGSANLSKLRTQCPALEEHFVVVNWDQRGAGKTYTFQTGGNALTLEQLRKDAHELTVYLRNRFGGRKLYLMGFSWGTTLGLWTAQEYPEDFHAFVSVSQEVNYADAERLSLAYVQQVARDTNNPQAIKELADIDPEYSTQDWYAQLMRERKWLLAFGGVHHATTNQNHEIGMLLKAQEYSLVDFAFWPFGSSTSLRTLWPELMRVNVMESVPRLDVPVYFLVGRHDYNSPSELIKTYYERLEAPQGKQIIWFENSAHDIFFDEPEALMNTLVEIKDKK
jgi:pimeloyl-ACP methyl ester carboxylesterase